MECETLYQRYRKLTLDTSLPTASTTYSRVGSLKNIFHNTTVTNSNEGSPICLKCGGPVHLDENLCPSVAFLEGYMYAVWFCVPYDYIQYTDILVATAAPA
ncbi:unnamed protein product [Aspergillus oryzae var. brunneus]|uniref:Unnamed protein product n=2 Tax=Aspergillus oryzae TaxID=5062 RepID=A0AAN4YT72_ASPOZ|nr:unnamed protein product [Aspergillus oryzae]GMG51419.1 unnamed protein product [Aspergillus oryzae var. brunneus]